MACAGNGGVVPAGVGALLLLNRGFAGSFRQNAHIGIHAYGSRRDQYLAI